MPLRILGVTHPLSWNNAACLLVDGELVAFVEEERLNRLKHSPRVPPLRAIDYCLKTGNTTLDQVDHIAIGWDHGTSPPPWGFGRKRYHVSQHHLHTLPFDIGAPRVHFVNHHISHALSSFLFSGFPEANVISLDATGGDSSGLLGVGRGIDLEVVQPIANDTSWGVFYGMVTGVLGFRPHSDEGKVMGLAAYGTPHPEWIDFIDWDRAVPWIHRKGMKAFVGRQPQRDANAPLVTFHKDLAATLQAVFERGVLQMAKFLHDRTGLKTFCLGGGCALNCSANGRLLREPYVDDLFVQPAAHDASTALGAAAFVHAKLTGQRPKSVFRHAYWGPQFSSDDVAALLRRAKIARHERPSDIEGAAADLLAQGRILGWFQGRMEVGPRALGGRSILADPRTPQMKDRVNKDVKGREPWRPFAPSFLDDAFAPFVTKPHPSPFMILAFQGTPGHIEKIPAAAHIDRTIRVQTVSKETNPRYHGLIRKFREKTGVPALLNTSFNIAGQPIVCTPFDALSTFFASGLDALVMEDYIVWK